MITDEQINYLSKFYQIDSFTIIREYLQLIFLKYFYQHRSTNKVFFKGGTALRIILGSPRFSEDLDFATALTNKQINEIIAITQKMIQVELPSLKILFLYKGKNTLRFRIKYKYPNFKYPSVIRLDFAQEQPIIKTITSPVVSKYPIAFFPVIAYLSLEEILAEKIRALSTRGKGRDFFDLWFLLAKDIKLDNNLIEKKFYKINKKFTLSDLIKKIKNHSYQRIKLDVDKFLPESQRKIVPLLKNLLLKQIGAKFS